MKIWLDDVRQEPPGWTRCYWPEEVIALLKGTSVSQMSLDHDLGDDNRGTGYDVLIWVEEQVATSSYNPPQMKVHSANTPARLKMEAAITQIRSLVENRPQMVLFQWEAEPQKKPNQQGDYGYGTESNPWRSGIVQAYSEEQALSTVLAYLRTDAFDFPEDIDFLVDLYEVPPSEESKVLWDATPSESY